MRQLCETLWVGHIGDARDFRSLHAAEIAALVDSAANEPPLILPREMIYCRFPIIDGAGNADWLLQATVAVASRLLRENIRTLIYCSGGMSRSVAVAAAALSTFHGKSPEEELVRVTRSIASDVSPGLWRELRTAVMPNAVE
jgi:protein-tyrosine phosphatase